MASGVGNIVSNGPISSTKRGLNQAMAKLDEKMKWIIRNFNAGAVATVNDDGTPAVSPKATFVIVDDVTLAFGDIRSPGTVTNLRVRPQTEINFIDVLHRRAVRVRGNAKVINPDSTEGKRLLPVFEELWQPYLDLMRHFVVIDIEEAKLVTSPAYDIGLTQEELQSINLKKINDLVE